MEVNIILRNMFFLQFVKWTFVISENTHNAECNLDITLPYLYSVIIKYLQIFVTKPLRLLNMFDILPYLRILFHCTELN